MSFFADLLKWKVPRFSTDASGNTVLLLTDGTTRWLPNLLDASVPSPDYHLALRGSQTGYGNLIDQSVNANDASINAALIPPAWTASTVVATNAYKSPITLNGWLYKATTGGTTGATEPVWPVTAGGTVTDGTVTWTCQNGPWYINSTTGVKQFRSIDSAQIGAAGSIALPAIDWDMAKGDSLIINIHGAFNFSAADEAVLLSNRTNGTAPGFSILGTGTTSTYKDLKFYFTDGTTIVNSGHVISTFNRKPLDGSVRTTTFMIDGKTKIAYCFGDAVAYTQAEMVNISNKSPNLLDMSTITGSTLSTQKVTIGGLTNSATSFELGMSQFDILVLKGRSLPANLQAVASFFHLRGLGLLPAGVLM